MQIVLGIDIGTTHCKIVAMTMEGQVVHTATGDYTTAEPSGEHSEQDAQLIFKRVFRLMQHSFSSLKTEGVYDYELKGVCFSGAMHSVLAVDVNGKPLSKAFTWADVRSNDCAMQLKALANAKEIYNATGTPIHPMSPLSKICWLRESMPEIFEAAHKFISIKEYVTFRLFGQYLIDHSIASATGLFDIHLLKWHDAALKAAGIDEAKLSAPVGVTHKLTGLKEEYRNLLEIDNDVPFFIGGSDGCLANLGSGVLSKDEASITIGTSGAVRVTADKPVPDDQQRLFNYILADGLYVSGGAVNNGGSALKWFAENFLDPFSADIEKLLKLSQRAPEGAGGLIFLPYLSGERAPFWDATARGAFIGLQASHRKEHLVRAVLEGVTYALKQVLQTVEEVHGNIEVVYGSGAFTKSEIWCQMVADILGKTIITQDADASATGAALMAWYGLNEIKDWSEVKQLIRNAKTFSPDDKRQAIYQQYFEIYCRLYPKLKETFGELGRLSIRKELDH